MDQLEEKSSVLARSGSFYYKSLPEKPKNEANFMSHLPWQTKLFNLGNISQNLALSGGYNRGNFRLIHFTDADIDYFGLQQALQERIVTIKEVIESVETPLRTYSGPSWDYTSANTIMEATWSQADLGADIVVPEGILQRVDISIPEDMSTTGYMHLLEKDTDGIYSELTVSDSAGTPHDGKMRWLFPDVKLSGKSLRVVITNSKDSITGEVGIASSVNHLDNDSVTKHGSSIFEGVVPELVFLLRVVVGVEVSTKRPDNLTINYVTGVLNEEGDVVADNNDAILFPKNDSTSHTIFNGTMRFGLRVSPDLWITSIQTPEKRLIAGYDFISEFGNLIFAVNPIQLFPDMSFMAYSFVERKRNLYSYSLRLDDVYGPVDRVLHYYRISQSPRSFYLAAAQAAGFAVVREDCTVTEILPFRNGHIYITDNGTYEAPYAHTRLNVGDSLTEGTVIGGDQLFKMIFPGDPWPSELGDLNLDGILPVKGLTAPDRVIEIYDADGRYRPNYDTISPDAFYAYWEFIDTYYAQNPTEYMPDIGSSGYRENAIKHVRDTVCEGKLLVACINYDVMSSDMIMRLEIFMTRELPVGSVLTINNLPGTIS